VTDFAHVTCLGCGLACDDITVTVQGGRITAAANACSLGAQWFGDGRVPSRIRVRGADAELPVALAEAARLLNAAKRPLVYLAAELSTQAQREACALADGLGALIDSISPTEAIVASQERGRLSATFGEIRYRTDTIVFWGVDPDRDYPRLRSRYLPPAAETIIADADPAVIRAAVIGHGADPLAARLTRGKYVAIFVDGEAHPERVEALLALTEALNGPTRAALVILRGGGNRVGAETVLTWQTGYPKAVDFARGTPRYCPDEQHDIDAALVIGSGATAPVASTLIAIGPRATESPFDATVAVDTGVAGIHDGGTAVRTDELPLPLRPALPGTVPETAATVRALADLVRRA
jgi:formylmethanofuran dehydrogenase subunit B